MIRKRGIIVIGNIKKLSYRTTLNSTFADCERWGEDSDSQSMASGEPQMLTCSRLLTWHV